MKKNSTLFFVTIFSKYTKVLTISVLLVVIYWSWFTTWVYASYFLYNKTFVVIKNTVITGYLADTEEKRVQGLSGKYFLPSDSAMVFDFDDPDTYGIWMKDMHFPIDIVWIDANKKIIYSLSNVEPSTYPQVFHPDTPALYVLEFKAGFLEQSGIKVGDGVYFDR